MFNFIRQNIRRGINKLSIHWSLITCLPVGKVDHWSFNTGHWSLIIFSVLVITSCSHDAKHPGYEYMPDMYRSPDYETNSENPLFPDSSSNRHPVHGTVARGNAIYADMDMLPYPFPNTTEGYEAAGKELHNPLEQTDTNMAEGKRLYNNYCIHCHGEKGMGDGSVTKHNGPIPPAYSSAQLKDLPEGKMFHTIHFGKNMMGPHSSQLTASQRWKIVMYVQTMQHTAGVTPADSSKAKTAEVKTKKEVKKS